MNITDISGIGEATAQRMKTHGIGSVEAVAHASIEQLVAIPGIGGNRAAALKEVANRMLSDATAGADASDADTGAEAPATAQTPAGDGEKPERPKKNKEKKKKKKSKKEKKRKKGKKSATKTAKKKEKKKDKGRKKRKKRGK